jgi:hypothetical protein
MQVAAAAPATWDVQAVRADTSPYSGEGVAILDNLGLPHTASTVVARLRANARTDVFADGVDVVDRGEGLVTAPQA